MFQSSGPQFASRVPGVPIYSKTSFDGVTVAGTRQWINPKAFISVVDPSTGACTGGDSVPNCQFGDSGRNTVRGPHFTDSDIYITKTIEIREGLTFRFDTQLFNAFNHANLNNPNALLGSAGFGQALYGRLGYDTGFPALVPLNETSRQVQITMKVQF